MKKLSFISLLVKLIHLEADKTNSLTNSKTNYDNTSIEWLDNNTLLFYLCVLVDMLVCFICQIAKA